MKIFKIIIWILFFYLTYIAILAFGYLPGICIIGSIIGGAIVSQRAYRVFYKKIQKWYDFILYPLTFIIIIIGLLFIPENTTGLYSMKNGEKEIIFQGMNHVGTKKYYNEVIKNIHKYRDKGYKIVYEGIRMEQSHTGSEVTDELEDIFNGTDFLKNKFLFFEGDIIGKKILEKGDLNIDISNIEIEKLFQERGLSKNLYKKQKFTMQASVTPDFSINNIIYKYKQKNISSIDYELIILYYNLGLLLGDIQNIDEKSILDSILKDYRDKHLYNEVMKLEYNKIFIIYGEGHVEGFYNHLYNYGSGQIHRIQELKPFQILEKGL